MTEHIFESAQALGEKVAEEICALLQEKPDALICLAAGHSSLCTFAALIEKKREGFDFSGMHFIAMDEWANMNDTDEESCGGFLQKNFLRPMEIVPEKYYLFDGSAEDRAGECERAERFIDGHGGIDYMLLGIGMNGHLALNEPGCDLNGSAAWIEISDTTKSVGQKYFSGAAELTGGVTLGLKDIKAARNIVLAITGEHKREMVRKLREVKAPTADFPASALVNLPHARAYIDRDALSSI